MFKLFRSSMYTKITKKSFNFELATSFILTVSIFSVTTFSSIVNASTLEASLSNRGSFTVNSQNSYDGPASNTLSFFSSFSDGNLYQMDSIQSSGSIANYTAFLVSELACYDGNDIPGFANQFGTVNSNGQFSSIINTDKKDPISSGTFTQQANQSFDFALKSPEGLFYSKDSKNLDNGAAHMLAVKVTKDGELNLPSSLNLRNNGKPTSFQLLSGDVVLFLEDMLATGNIASGLIPFASDFDYNDMVIVLRASEIPEPSTVFLLGSAAMGMILRRRKTNLV